MPGSKVYFEKYELNEHLKPFYEYLVKNSSQSDRYNPHALAMQLNFLMQRVRIEKELDNQIQAREAQLRTLALETSESLPSESDRPPVEIHVIDRSIFEDNEIFAKNQLDSGMMTQEEYLKYLEVYSKHIEEIMTPDLMVIMSQDAKVLHERVMKRGREMEKEMSLEYLQNLNDRYANSLEPFLKSRNVRFIRQNPEGPKEMDESNQYILDLIKKELDL